VREYNSVAWRFCIKTQSITLDGTTVVGGVQGVAEYQLTDFFRTPIRCNLLDAQGLSRTLVTWMPYAEWLVWRRDQLTGTSLPIRYTARNVHETGMVTFDPRPFSILTYPTARLVYASWIALQPTAGLTLDVPPDVDEGIFQLAVANLIAKNKRFGDDAKMAFEKANQMRQWCERNHRVHIDMVGWGANG
jgi:hypothetical protein